MIISTAISSFRHSSYVAFCLTVDVLYLTTLLTRYTKYTSESICGVQSRPPVHAACHVHTWSDCPHCRPVGDLASLPLGGATVLPSQWEQWEWRLLPLEKVNCYKYLGLYLFSDMNFSKTARFLSESATRAPGSLISKYKSAKFMHYHTYTKLFNSLVCPITEYGAGIWGLGEFKNINKILLTACRTYLGAHRHHVAKTCLVADMGWVSDYNRRQIEMLRTWNRLIKLTKDRLTYKIFQWSYERNSAWCRDIQEVFSRCKMLDVYLNKITCNLSEAKEEFLKAQERQFKTETLFKPKLKLYRKIKQTYNNTAAFVSNINNRKSRSLITLLRAGCLPLELEIGRWYNVPRESRICKLCTSGEVEDEVHFICSCGALKETRDTYAESLQFDFDQTASHTINEIESFMTDQKVVKQFARFITAMYETRKNILYKNTTV